MAGYDSNQINNYKKAQIETASPDLLILMLFDGALKFLKRARSGFENMDFELINNGLIKTQAIISELMTSLDMEKGGEVAKNLLSLYIFVNKNLSQANVEKDAKYLDVCEEITGGLREAWDEMMKKNATKGEDRGKTQGSNINFAV
ncbi:flagellar export chaperone FliS [Candidatus Riflebacteria bacterium]